MINLELLKKYYKLNNIKTFFDFILEFDFEDVIRIQDQIQKYKCLLLNISNSDKEISKKAKKEYTRKYNLEEIKIFSNILLNYKNMTKVNVDDEKFYNEYKQNIKKITSQSGK